MLNFFSFAVWLMVWTWPGRGYFDYVTPAAGRSRGLYMCTGVGVKKLFKIFCRCFVDGDCMDAHSSEPISSRQTEPPLIIDSGMGTQVKAGNVVTSPVRPKSSTPIVPTSSSDPTSELHNLINELGQQIGNSIGSQLFTTTQAVLPSSDSFSPVNSFSPMNHLYATHPNVGESPVDYWVYLNTATEQADRHLRKQDRKLENMSAEISMMFIRN